MSTEPYEDSLAEPGRSCPLHYRYGAAALQRTEHDLHADTLYVAGGLYGNRPALDALGRMVDAERGNAQLLFNGDFHWFDVDPHNFADVQRRVLAHRAIAGNVEAELADGSGDAGCGCAYPDDVPHAVVDRSNRIHTELSRTARHDPHWRGELAALDFWRGVRIGDARVGVVHGDAESLAGWDFDARALRDPGRHAHHVGVFDKARCDILASSHTCLPALARFEQRAVINNGTAGMPNFREHLFGVVSRIALTPSPHPVLYGTRIGALHVDALALRYDVGAWLAEFNAQWPDGSPAALNYRDRILAGPAWTIAEAQT
ncbi:MAG: hypothetical protein KBF58_02175 [Methyloversatilis sp.]|jgi:hypothetical protein|nr:hypothetical protein [Methyloversatilis sp.]MBP6193020.1 hypothetical protein [Methyloversatilis sp.]MBP9116865.1 hypothetical protein [Methyloversatilis sp.]